MNGYQGEANILFDEFNSQILLSNMLMYMDVYPVQLDVKGSYSYANWNNVIITSNDNPQTLYPNASNEKRAAFARRIRQVLEFTEEGVFATQSFVFKREESFVSADAHF